MSEAGAGRVEWVEAPAGRELVGRDAECAELDRLLAGVRAGESRVLVLRGEAGAGKSALLDHLAARSSGCRVVAAAGAESEMELPFAGVHRLCLPMLDVLDALPGPRRDALGTAFGMRAGAAPDPSLIGLAVLDLLARTAAERPLVCVVDDAQWLDRASAQVLAVVGDSLAAGSVACVFAVRDGAGDDVLPGLPVLAVGGLGDAGARALLGRAVPGPLDEEVRARILAEARGNPLALLELAAAAAAAGGFVAAVEARPLPGTVEDDVRRRLDGLSPGGRMAVLLAAADPVGDPALLRRAAAVLGIGDAAIEAADALIDIGERVRFRHPLVRSAVYGAAVQAERWRAHGALAEATDADADPDRRVWHRAHGAAHPDEDTAAELERLAERARARGGPAAAAAFLERAAGLTPDARRRAERALDAAHAKRLAGAPKAALALLAAADAGPLDEYGRARAKALRAEIALASDRAASAPAALLRAAERLEPLDAVLSRDTYLKALSGAIGVLPEWDAVTAVAAVARNAPPVSGDPRAADLVLDALSLLYTSDAATAEPAMRRALAAGLRREGVPAERPWSVALFALAVWDDESCHELASHRLGPVRDSGTLPLLLGAATTLRLLEGDLAGAEALNAEAKATTPDAWTTSRAVMRSGDLSLAAWRGDEEETERLADAVAKESAARGDWRTVEVAHWARSVLCNGLGRYERAVEVALVASVDSRAPAGCGVHWAPLELIEAAARTGRDELAARTLERLSRSTRAGGTEWGLGLEARCRALLREGEEAERGYREAIDRLGRTRMRADLARAHLLYGEWLRRERRRTQARENLRTALDLFTGIGMNAFADRAARELRATGETVRTRDTGALEQLTPQEAQVADLAAAGLTNKQIAARLYVSPRTVEHHLRKVFAKLGVTSRHELTDLR